MGTEATGRLMAADPTYRAESREAEVAGLNNLALVDSPSPSREVGRSIRYYTAATIESAPGVRGLSPAYLDELRAVASVLPFRVNNHVVETLIDWDNIPNDPIFRLVFPQRDMLPEKDFARVFAMMRQGAPKAEIARVAGDIRADLNPHPDGQMELNRPPDDNDGVINGLQHKYRETVLFFPSEGQTCHSYCNFCFRWAQFVGDKTLKMALSDAERLHSYLAAHPEVSDVLITGGDPMIMKSASLERYIETLLSPDLAHVQTVRIGTKALSFWPYRFTTDADADRLIAALARLIEGGKHVAIMAHVNHWRELDNAPARDAVARLKATGAVIRSQSPFLRGINDDAATLAEMWRRQVGLGIVPYYMFIARDTGAKTKFDIPLARAFQVFRQAYSAVSGLARTVRGPSMSTADGKVEITNIVELGGRPLFLLRFLQARDPEDSYRVLFADYCERATWFDELSLIDPAKAGVPASCR